MKPILLLSTLLILTVTACPDQIVPSLNGVVLDQTGQPVFGLKVLIQGAAVTQTDSAGKFHVENITAPYTLNLVDAQNKRSLSVIGLTRLDPTVVFYFNTSTRREATLSGALGGSGYVPNPPASYETTVAFKPSGISDYANNLASGSPPPNTYGIRPYWYGPASTSGTVFALQWEKDANGQPKSYKGYGSAAVTLNDGSPAAANLSLSPLNAQIMNASVTVPAGYTLQQRNLYLRFDGSQTGAYPGIQFVASLDTTTSFSLNTPDIPGAFLGLDQSATDGAGKYVSSYVGNLSANASVNLNLTQVPQQLEPLDAATGVTNATSFKWSAVSGSVYLLNVYGVGGLEYNVLTTATSVSLPDLGAAGFPLPRSSQRSWSLSAFSPVASVDAATSASGWLHAPNIQIAGGFKFTTAP